MGENSNGSERSLGSGRASKIQLDSKYILEDCRMPRLTDYLDATQSTNKSQFDELIKTARDGAARNKKLREQKPEETQDTSDDQAPAAQGKGVAATLAVSDDDDDVEAVVD